MHYNATKTRMFIGFLLFGFAQTLWAHTPKTIPKPIETALDACEVVFEENKGQVKNQDGNLRADIWFRGQSQGMDFFIRNNGISYQLSRVETWKDAENELQPKGLTSSESNDPEKQGPDEIGLYRVDVEWIGANAQAVVERGQTIEAYNHYYNVAEGQEPVLNVHSYKWLRLKNLWPGVDMKYYSRGGVLESDWELARAEDHSMIRFKVEGAKLRLEGDILVMETPFGEIREGALRAQQNGRSLKAAWVIEGQTVGLSISGYSPGRPMTIDPPVVVWGTYYGGSGHDYAYALSTDAQGNLYMAGVITSGSSSGIATSGAHQANYGGGDWDAFLVKFDGQGNRLWGSYYGGNGWDEAFALSTDGQGHVYMAGYTTSSSGIATSGAHQANHGGGDEAYLVKFDGQGNRLWGTYYGGSSDDRANALSTDGQGHVYMAGYTYSSSGIATSGAHQANYGGGSYDAFLVKFDGQGNRLWGTYYGGSSLDYAYALSTDAQGLVYMSGLTYSSSGIATTGSHQANYGGGTDAFLVKFDGQGNRLWATYFGGSSTDRAHALSTDAQGNVYMAGFTSSSSGIATSGAHQANHGGGIWDAFLVKFDGQGNRLWGTYYGGSGHDRARALSTDAQGNVFMAGETGSFSGIATSGSHQANHVGGVEAYLVKFSDNSAPIAQAPTLSTQPALQIGAYSASAGGQISLDGGAAITDKGLCWSTQPNAGLQHQSVSAGGGSDSSFTVQMLGLQAGTTYYYRAYAINSVDTAYGNELFFTTLPHQTSPGSLDTTFDPGTGANAFVRAVAFQTDGKVIIAGDFNYYDGISRNGIARLNADGSLDAAFNTGTGTVNQYGSVASIYAIALQQNGKVLIGGQFTSYNGINRNRIARLNADGSLDTTFNPVSGANDFVNAIVIQSDGKILIGGLFTSYYGTAVNRIARLNSDGSLDATFNPGSGTDGPVYNIALQPDGKILIGGYFTLYNGTSLTSLARLNADGSLDSTFSPVTSPNIEVLNITLQPDGKILIGGYFGEYDEYNNAIPLQIARLNTDGSVDASFNPGTGANRAVFTMALQSDGKIFIGGGFTFYNGTSINSLARLNTDGSLDTTFSSYINDDVSWGFVYAMARQPDNNILIGGGFTSYNGASSNYIARIIGGNDSPLFAPTLSTRPALQIGAYSASAGGQISFDGGAAITDKGLCWNTQPNASLQHQSVSAGGSSDSSFTVQMLGLQAGTTYYYRAYAINSVGTAYGNELMLSTPSNLKWAYSDSTIDYQGPADGGFLRNPSADWSLSSANGKVLFAFVPKWWGGYSLERYEEINGQWLLTAHIDSVVYNPRLLGSVSEDGLRVMVLKHTQTALVPMVYEYLSGQMQAMGQAFTNAGQAVTDYHSAITTFNLVISGNGEIAIVGNERYRWDGGQWTSIGMTPNGSTKVLGVSSDANIMAIASTANVVEVYQLQSSNWVLMGSAFSGLPNGYKINLSSDGHRLLINKSAYYFQAGNWIQLPGVAPSGNLRLQSANSFQIGVEVLVSQMINGQAYEEKALQMYVHNGQVWEELGLAHAIVKRYLDTWSTEQTRFNISGDGKVIFQTLLGHDDELDYERFLVLHLVENYVSAPKVGLVQNHLIEHNRAHLNLRSYVHSGSSAVTDRGVVWGTSSDPTIGHSQQMSLGPVMRDSLVSIGPLQKNTRYYVRTYLSNAHGSSYSPNFVFTTPDSLHWDTLGAPLNIRDADVSMDSKGRRLAVFHGTVLKLYDLKGGQWVEVAGSALALGGNHSYVELSNNGKRLLLKDNLYSNGQSPPLVYEFSNGQMLQLGGAIPVIAPQNGILHTNLFNMALNGESVINSWSSRDNNTGMEYLGVRKYSLNGSQWQVSYQWDTTWTRFGQSNSILIETNRNRNVDNTGNGYASITTTSSTVGRPFWFDLNVGKFKWLDCFYDPDNNSSYPVLSGSGSRVSIVRSGDGSDLKATVFSYDLSGNGAGKLGKGFGSGRGYINSTAFGNGYSISQISEIADIVSSHSGEVLVVGTINMIPIQLLDGQWVSMGAPSKTAVGDNFAIDSAGLTIGCYDVGGYRLYTLNKPEKAELLATSGAIGRNTAEVSVQFVSGGSDTSYLKGLCWNTSGNPHPDTDTSLVLGYGDHDFSAVLNGLDPATTYYIRAFSENAAALAFSNELVVTTSAASQIVPQLSLSDSTHCGNLSLGLLGVPPDSLLRVRWYKDGVLLLSDSLEVRSSGSLSAGGNGQGGLHKQLRFPYGIARDANGSIYVSDQNNHRIMRWDAGAADGVKIVGAGPGGAANQLRQPMGIAVDAQGYVYVADRNNHRVMRYAPGSANGVVVAGGQGQGSALNQLNRPEDVAIGSDGSVYVVDQNNHRVMKWLPGAQSGILVAGDGRLGAARFRLNQPSGIALDANDNMYIADRKNHRIMRWNAGDVRGTSVAGGQGEGTGLNQLNDPVAVAVDAQGALYIADMENHRVMLWQPGANQGVQLAGSQGFGTQWHQLNMPSDLVIDGIGRLWVCDNQNHRVVQWGTQAPGLEISTQNAGSYSAEVLVRPNHLLNSGSLSFTVSAPPVAAFGASGPQLSWSFTNQSTGADLYQWYFGDGQSSTEANPTHVYSQAGTYEVCLVASDSCGRQDSSCSNLVVIDRLYGQGLALSLSGAENCREEQLSLQGVSAGELLEVKLYQNGNLLQQSQYAPASSGLMVAGTGLQGGQLNQLRFPQEMAYVEPYIYVVDRNNNRILRFTEGQSQAVVVAGGNGSGTALNQIRDPRGIVADELGGIYVSDRLNHRILYFASGSVMGSLVAGGNGPGQGLNQFNRPAGITKKGNVLYIADEDNHRVIKWTLGSLAGEVVAGNGVQGNGLHQLFAPANVAVDSIGRVYVADRGNNRVMRWTPSANSGVVMAGAGGQGSGADQLSAPYDVDLDAYGNMYVVDMNNQRVMKYLNGANSGLVVAGNGVQGNGLNQLRFPTGMAMQDHKLYVVDHQNHRIMRWDEQFPQTVFGTAGSGSYAADLSFVNGGTQSTNTQVFTLHSPSASFNYTLTGLNLMAISNSQQADSLYWSFGDGQFLGSTTGDVQHSYAGDGLYTLCLTAYDSCGQSSQACIDLNALSLRLGSGSSELGDVRGGEGYNQAQLAVAESKTLGQWQVYPNPTDGKLHLKMEVGGQYELINAAGQVLIKGISQQAVEILDLTNFKSGLYTLRLQTNRKLEVVKVRLL